MLKLALFVGIGGFLGSISRFVIYQWFLKLIPGISPAGTLFVNIIGSFILGFLVHYSSRLDRELFLLLTTGFCGGFTTYSTFSIENINYLSSGNMANAVIYIGISLVLGFGAAFLGWYISKNLLGL